MASEPPTAHNSFAVRIAPFVLALNAIAMGGGLWFAGSRSADDAEGVEDLEPIAPDAALLREGELVAVRGSAQTNAPLHEPGVGDDLIYIKHTRTERRREWGTSSSSRQYRTETKTVREAWTPAFRLGPLVVRPADAKVIQPSLLRSEGDDAWYGLQVGAPLTVVGTVKGGEIAGGEPFLISPLPADALNMVLSSRAKVFRLYGAATAGVGVVLLIGFLIYRRFVRGW